MSSLAAPQNSGTTPRRLKVLVVDDNVDAADTLAVLLEHFGCDARTAYNGRQAVETAREFAPELVILDINMPVMNGYDAARELKRALPRAVLVAFTAQTSLKDQAAARAAGFNLHLGKPLDPRDLGRLIQDVLPARLVTKQG